MADAGEVKEEPELVQAVQVFSAPKIDMAVVKNYDSQKKDYLDDILINGNDIQKRMLASLQAFEEGLRPRTPIADAVGAKIQYEFLSALLWLMKKDYGEFRDGWNTVLIFFAEKHGETNGSANYTALSEYSTGRFLSVWSKGAESCTAYSRLIALIRATRHAEKRKTEMKSIDLAKIAPTILTDEMLSNLKNFYQV